ncbi:hypothetical protein [Leucobacter japonicus]|uniref:hypothetical protein n=1 Tax=Leucobacter japonicus TaxID=1461259 RepID=UPI0006A76D5D|nr:hypothetical protein [Leucobacter japonicus]
MSEQDEQRPLTRRERRMRELGETGAMDLAEAVPGTSAPAAVEPEPTADTPATQASVPNAPTDSAPVAQTDPATGDIEISPVNPDGTPRSRRELRQLREAALAERAAAQPEDASSAESAQADAAVSAAPVGPEPAAAEEPAVADSSAVAEIAEPAVARGENGADSAPSVDDAATPSAAPEVDFDSLISPPTEPFTVEELREAETAANAAVDEARPSGEPAQPADEPEAFTESATSPAGGPEKSKRRFPWQRAKADEAEPTPEAVPAESAETAPAEPVQPASEVSAESDPEASVASEDEAENAAVRDADVSAASPVDAAAPTAVIDSHAVRAISEEAPESIPEVVPPREPADDLPVAPAAETVALPTQAAAVAPKQPEPEATPSSPEQKSSYSFPDIAPPEEWRSVFDDPASRQFPTPGTQPGGDFDDLISRAVAQEGSTGGTGTSALILPTMPEDTGGLTGPLGATGDLYVTGSLHLPKSLGETGGHSAIHDSIEMDPITGDQLSEPSGDGSGPAPVSARHAVSARVDSGMPVVAKPAREKSKLPLILSLTGGGLLIVVVALGAWGASNGFFG